MKKAKLVVFDLPAVIDFNRPALKGCLVEALSKVAGVEAKDEDLLLGKWNSTGAVDAWYNENLGRSPEEDEWKKIRKAHLKCVKNYFVASENNFEVWSGIQNLLKTIEKKKTWDYMVLSEFWDEDTRFILDSCGFYSKGMHLLTAEESYRSGPQLKRFLKNSEYRSTDKIYLVTQDLKRKNVTKNRKRWNLIRQKPPRHKKSSEVQYPRFGKFF